MQAFIRALQSERVKISLLKMLGAMIILNLVINLPLVYNYLTSFNLNEIEVKQYNFLSNHIDSVLGILYYFIYPLYVVAIICTIINVDFKHNGYKLIETQNLGKFNIYLSKVVWSLIIAALFIIVTVVFNIIVAKLCALKFSDNAKVISAIDGAMIWAKTARLYISTFGLMGIIFILMFAFKRSIIVNIIAFIGIIASIIRYQQGLLQKWVPTNYFLISSVNDNHQPIMNDFLWASLVVFLGSLIIGYLFYTHRNHKGLIFKDIKAIAITVVTILGTTIFTGWILQPRSQAAYDKTIVAGKIESDIKMTQIKLYDANYDELAVIPVQDDGTFHMELTDVNLNIYGVDGNTINLGKVVLKPNDSLYLDINTNTGKFDVLGTGYADNYLMIEKRLSSSYYYSPEYLQRLPKEQALDYLKGDFEESIARLNLNTTPDNYTYSEKRLEQVKNLIKVGAVLSYDDYVTVYKSKNPDEVVEDPEYIALLRTEIPKNDPDLFFDETYQNYVAQQYYDPNKIADPVEKIQIITQKVEEPLKSKFLQTIFYNAVNKGNIRQGALDSMYQALQSAGLNSIIAKRVQQKYDIISLSTSGKLIPNFSFVNLDGQQVSLEQYKGKIVVIDFWATWCGPCKYQYPELLSIANTYKDNNNIQFVAISIDEDMNKWKIDASKKDDRIEQWHITDKSIMEYFNVQSIPRFVLIGKQGEILNKSMPFPDNQDAFKVMIDNHLK